MAGRMDRAAQRAALLELGAGREEDAALRHAERRAAAARARAVVRVDVQEHARAEHAVDDALRADSDGTRIGE